MCGLSFETIRVAQSKQHLFWASIISLCSLKKKQMPIFEASSFYFSLHQTNNVIYLFRNFLYFHSQFFFFVFLQYKIFMFLSPTKHLRGGVIAFCHYSSWSIDLIPFTDFISVTFFIL